MKRTFNTILDEAGIRPEDVRLLRHKDSRAEEGRTPYELWRDNRSEFVGYQSLQNIRRRKTLDAILWAAFVVPPNNKTTFAGLYRAKYLGLLQRDRPKRQGAGVDKAREWDEYELVPDPRLSDQAGELVIEWGDGANARVQYAARHDKLVIEERRTAQPDLADDLAAIFRRPRTKPTTTKALVDARLGQGEFRKNVLGLWGNRCCVTGATTQAAIRASHIKPWRGSTDDERLDPENGLPLIASLDALFDAGLISFDAAGKMLVSRSLDASERRIFGLGKPLTKRPTKQTASFLAGHRKRFF